MWTSTDIISIVLIHTEIFNRSNIVGHNLPNDSEYRITGVYKYAIVVGRLLRK